MTTDTPMVERLIELVRFEHNNRTGEGPCGYRDYHGHAGAACDDRSYCTDAGYREECACRRMASAFLECLRTPTPEMQVAGAHVCDQRPSEAGRVFTAMIDRALLPSIGEGE